MHAGDVVWNPLTGEKAMLVESAEESGGSRIVTDLAVEGGGFVPGGEHVHDVCAEHLEVKAGQITFLLDGEERTVTAGEEVSVVPGTWHRWWNAGQDEVQMRVRIEPALRFEQAILVAWGLCTEAPLPGARRACPATRLGADDRSLPRSSDAPLRRIGARSPSGTGNAADRLGGSKRDQRCGGVTLPLAG